MRERPRMIFISPRAESPSFLNVQLARLPGSIDASELKANLHSSLVDESSQVNAPRARARTSFRFASYVRSGTDERKRKNRAANERVERVQIARPLYK